MSGNTHTHTHTPCNTKTNTCRKEQKQRHYDISVCSQRSKLCWTGREHGSSDWYFRGTKVKAWGVVQRLWKIVLNYVTKKYDYADKLIGIFHNLEDPMEKYDSKYLLQKDMSIANEGEQKELWQIGVREWRQQKGKVETCMVKT
eukprot:8304626-Ditylum_brightwellii.AAC.1